MIVLIDGPDGETTAIVVTPRLQAALDRFAGVPGVKDCPSYLRDAWAEAKQ